MFIMQIDQGERLKLFRASSSHVVSQSILHICLCTSGLFNKQKGVAALQTGQISKVHWSYDKFVGSIFRPCIVTADLYQSVYGNNKN